jgi:glucokinase
MNVLVADIGGTNARLGIAVNGIVDPQSVVRFANENYGSFYDVVTAYTDIKSQTEFTSAVVAVAGPITDTAAELTNRNWVITTDALKRLLQCDEALLINDLASLGYAVTHLTDTGILTVSQGKQQTPENTQYLVVGIGTGFNVCAVRTDITSRPSALQAECGHISLPRTVLEFLDADTHHHFNTVEELFSGRGLSKLHAVLTQTDPIDGQEIAQNHLAGMDPHATKTLRLYAQMLGALTRELLLMYMPTGGVYFAGSVGRGIFEAGLEKQFMEVLHQNHFIEAAKDIPIRIIADDGAGLTGCAILSKQI